MSRKAALIIGSISSAFVGVLALLGKRKADQTTDAIKSAAQAPSGSPGTTFLVHATGYWPFTARPDERKMEGGTKDRKGAPLYTLEDFQAGNAPFVSVSGDYEIFPYGQRLSIAEWPNVVFRVVDTGSHFHGLKKVYRVAGREPLDICVVSSATKVIADTEATIYPGDHFEKGSRDVALQKIGKPTVSVGDGLNYFGIEET